MVGSSNFRRKKLEEDGTERAQGQKHRRPVDAPGGGSGPLQDRGPRSISLGLTDGGAISTVAQVVGGGQLRLQHRVDDGR